MPGYLDDKFRPISGCPCCAGNSDKDDGCSNSCLAKSSLSSALGPLLSEELFGGCTSLLSEAFLWKDSSTSPPFFRRLLNTKAPEVRSASAPTPTPTPIPILASDERPSTLCDGFGEEAELVAAAALELAIDTPLRQVTFFDSDFTAWQELSIFFDDSNIIASAYSKAGKEAL